MNPIYLDNNATTRIDPRVAEAMGRCYLARHGNPASQHAVGRRARRVVETAREQIGELLGCRTRDAQADRLIFTSGGTESNNLALLGMAGEPPGEILISAIEHPSVLMAARQLMDRGFTVQLIPVTPDGTIRLDQFQQMVSDRTRLVSVMLGNNETGVLQPVRELAAACRDRGILLHTDAVQAVGKIPVHFAELDVDALSLTAHKFHGPSGIGALLVRAGVPLSPILSGGHQQLGERPGTEAVALAAGMQRALELWQTESRQRLARATAQRDRLEALIRRDTPTAVIVGAAAPRLPHTINVSFPGLDRQAIAMALDLEGVACSTGSACASGSAEPSPVLLAMGLAPPLIDGSIRLSLGADTTDAEVAEAARRIRNVIKTLDRSAGG
jgi:cysteine desulfurase